MKRLWIPWFHKKKASRGKKRHFFRGQVSLELSLALTCLFILILSSVKICAWLVGQLAYRQETYEATRTSGGNVDDSGYPQLDVFSTH